MDKRKITLTVIGVAVLLVVLVGSTYAYWTANTENKISTNTTIQTGVLKLVLDDGTNKDGILTGLINPNNTKFTTYLSITNEGTYDTFAKLYFKGLTNTFSSDLVYSIEEVDSLPSSGSEPKIVKRIKYQVPVPGSLTSSRELLADGLLIKMGTLNGNNLTPNTEYYRVTVEYLYSDTVDQSSDMGKTFYTGFDIEQGDKVTENIVMIDNIDQLVELANEVNAGDSKSGKEYRLMRNFDFNDDDSYLDATETKYGDINKNGTIESIKTELTTGAGWTPIGTETNPYSGDFNGQSYEIQHLYINNNDANITNVGLFGVVNNSNITNLGIRDEKISTQTVANISGIAAVVKNGTIDNCHNAVTIKNSNPGITSNLTTNASGGLVGWAEGNVVVKDSYNEANISGSHSAGGIIGWTIANTIIQNSYNSGNVNSTYNAGGFLGSCNGYLIIDKSYNTGSAQAKQFAGGLVGTIGIKDGVNTGYFLDSYNTGNITTTPYNSDAWSNAAGLVAGVISMNAHIINSYSTGTISGDRIGNGITMSAKGSKSSYLPVVTINNVYNIGSVYGGNLRYGIAYNDLGTITLSNSYYLSGISGSNVANSTALSLSQMQDASFVNTLNNNRSSITLPSELSGYTLSTWCTSDNGPVLDYQVPESERSTRCPAYVS